MRVIHHDIGSYYLQCESDTNKGQIDVKQRRKEMKVFFEDIKEEAIKSFIDGDYNVLTDTSDVYSETNACKSREKLIIKLFFSLDDNKKRQKKIKKLLEKIFEHIYEEDTISTSKKTKKLYLDLLRDADFGYEVFSKLIASLLCLGALLSIDAIPTNENIIMESGRGKKGGEKADSNIIEGLELAISNVLQMGHITDF